MEDALSTPEQREALARADRKGRKEVDKTTRALKTLEVTYLPPDKIKPNPWNPNRQSQHDFELLLRSMEEDGFTQSVVCVRLTEEDFETPAIKDAGYLEVGDVMIVDGEHRWRAGNKLGYPEIPVAITPMTAAQAMIATLRHNRARGSEDIEMAADLLRDLEQLGALGWAQDSLMMDDVEIQRLLDDIPAPEALAAEQYGGAWEPDRGVDPAGEALQVAGQTVDAPSGQWTKAASPAAVEAAREREHRMAEAKTDEQRAMVKQDTARDFYRLSLVFSGEEATTVKSALGGAPAETLASMCADRVGVDAKLKEEGWVSIDAVIGTRMIPAESAKVIAAAIAKAKLAGDVTDKNPWQLLEYLSADYGAGLDPEQPPEQ